LPDTPLRIGDQQPPPATSGWLDYRETWLISLPIYMVAMTFVLFAASHFLPRSEGRRRLRGIVAPAAGVLSVLVTPLLLGNIWVDSGGKAARLEASGSARVEHGSWYSDQLEPAQATLELAAKDRVRKVTPLPPHDELDMSAHVEHSDGNSYDIVVDKPMVSDAAGRHTTWWGVGIDVWHHGKSGIGTDQIPAVRADLAVFGIGKVAVDGRPVAVNVPVHVMTGEGEFGGRLELDVGDPDTLVPTLPEGHLRVVWSDYNGGPDRDAEWTHYAIGDVVLALLLLFGIAATRGTAPNRRRRT
jgi:hypothetical protein